MNTVARYLRLSNEDGEKMSGAESESIRNQRDLINNYLDRHDEFQGWDRIELCDDGWSGTNFARPGMQKLLELVKQGRVQCIIVKDFSRFGRDYLTVGDYVTRVFPFMGVRFISLGDGYDSADPDSLDDLSVSFSTIIYDLYSKELSGKTRMAKDRLAREGAFFAPAAPFGYRKDPEQKNHLVIDQDAAETVRTIFERICAGERTVEVARQMNRDGVLTPMQYKRSSGSRWLPWPCVSEDNFWTGDAVTRIIRDQRYLGHTIYGKRRRAVIGDTHTVKVSQDDWIMVKHTHEAIVSEKQFSEAQSMLRAYRERKETKPQTLLARKVYCACCGHAMVRGKKGFYSCETSKVSDRYACSEERVPEEVILDAVLSAVHTYARLAVDLDRLLLQQWEQVQQERKQRERKVMVLRSKKEQSERCLLDMYESFIEGSISKENYIARKTALSQQLSRFSDEIKALESAQVWREDDKTHYAIETYKSYTELDTLAAGHIRELLERVTVYPNKILQVRLNFTDELETVAEQFKGQMAN